MTGIGPIIAGILLSAGLVFLLAWKWKIPSMPAIMGGGAATLVAAAAFWWFSTSLDAPLSPITGLIGQPALATLLGLSLLMVRFWRDPERQPPAQDGVVLSAADGQVIYIRETDANETPLITKSGRDYSLTELTGTDLLAQPAYVIGVEMSFMDVHVNRCPINGQVKLLEFIEGKFISLRKDEAPFINERFTTIIENDALMVGVVQVASRLVRCIRNYLTQESLVQAGERLGIIRLGSLVAIIIPKHENVLLTVKPGDRVTAGVSILARYKTPREEALL